MISPFKDQYNILKQKYKISEVYIRDHIRKKTHTKALICIIISNTEN